MNKETLKKNLKAIGLKKGDIVLVHSALAAIGNIEGGGDTLLDAFMEVLGKDGTLVVPTFGSLGKFTELVGKRPGVFKSIHPVASVAALGKDAKDLCRDHWKAETAHAEDTPYMRIAEKGGYIMLIGVDQDRNTTLHTVEALLQLPYLKEINRTFETETGEKVTGSWKHFPGPHRDFIGIDKILRNSGKMKTGKIGNAVTRLIKSQDLLDLIMEEGRRNPAFALCDNPNCDDCVKQRAKISSHILSLETFTTAASAALAGKYVPEIIENMEAAGIKNIELDYLQGIPLNALNTDKIATAIEEFRKADINVISLKFQCVPDKFQDFIELAAKYSISRIVVPLTEYVLDAAKEAEQRNVKLSLFNSNVSSTKASEILLSLKNNGADISFTFSPANFAIAGEKPFLGSIKKKLRRFMDQLYIEDATFAGTSEALANGNAEIKELVSILRCASFDGYMVLAAGNKQNGNLKSTIERFIKLLENM